MFLLAYCTPDCLKALLHPGAPAFASKHRDSVTR
jgi:hypothetical protein